MLARLRSTIESDDEGLEMTPMIDVTFLLLVFFLCTIRFKSLEGKLGAYLPKELGLVSDESVVPPIPVDVRLSVVEPGERVDPLFRERPWSGTGRYVVRPGTRVLNYRVGPHATRELEGLVDRLGRLAGGALERTLTIRADAGVLYGDVVPVLDAARSAGYSEITFAGAR